MRFIDPTQSFKQIVTANGQFFYRGRCNISWTQLAEKLDQGNFPERLRGNFAAVWIGNDGKVLTIVDHLATIPLFFSGENISWSFLELTRVEPQLTENEKFERQLKVYKGFNFTDETRYKEISRVRPGHYWDGRDQNCYLDLTQFPGNQELKPDVFMEAMEKTFARGLQERNIILLSGGTDSALLAGLSKKLGLTDKIRFIHISSAQQIRRETDLVKALEAKLKIKVEYFSVDMDEYKQKAPQLYPDDFYNWRDPSFFIKAFCLNQLDISDEQIITGEVGDQLFGGPKLAAHSSYALQMPNWTAEDIARQFINLSNNAWPGVKESPWTQLFKTAEPEVIGVYQEEVNEIANLFKSMSTKDLLNRFMNLNLILKGPFRVHPYSQDHRNYFHPFAEWEVVEQALMMKSKYKVSRGGLLKMIYFDLWESFLIEEIWKAPKTGISLHLTHRIRA